MLSRNPSKRPTLEQLQKDSFFSSIDWKKLAKKEIDPPVILKKGGKESKESVQTEDEISMLFENPEPRGDAHGDEQRGGGKPQIHTDEDYTEENRTYNRVKNYSFARI